MYQYAPIDAKPRVFRLIKLLKPIRSYLPSSRDTVRLEIIEVDLDAACSYDALSYTWGVQGLQQPDRRVIVETPDGSRELRIFRPLELALLHLAATNYADRPLFVDQICINQSDDGEKGSQVPLMRDIYTNCARVVVWLGPASRSSDKWFDFTREVCNEGILSRFMQKNVGHFMNVFDAVMDPSREVTAAEREDRDDILWLLSQYGHLYPLDGLADVLGRAWFNRLWIIQESCLAPSVIFVSGTRSLCFDCFRSGTLFYNIYNTHWLNNVQHSVSQGEVRRRSELLNVTRGLIRIFQERKAIHTAGRRQQLYDVLLKYNVNDDGPKIGATLPEDRLYGLLGLVGDDDSLHGLDVRYGDAIKVYTEFAGMLARKNIDVLLFSQSPKRIAGLPSWVPDWSMDLKVPHAYTNLTTPVFKPRRVDDQQEPNIDLDLGRLAVQGMVIDRIIQVGRQSMHSDPERQVTALVDFRSVRRFTAEIDEFLQLASDNPLCPFPYSSNEELRLQAAVRLSDSALSEKHFSEALGSTTEAIKKLQALHGEAAKWGQRLIDTDRQVKSYHINRIIGTVGIIPWYCVPVGEVDVLRLCAADPIFALKTGLKGAALFLVDALGICASSAAVVLFSKYLRIRRRFTGVRFNDPGSEEIVTKVGLSSDLIMGHDMSTYRENLLKNIGRRVYLTEKGYLGLGPGGMMHGDFVAFLFGGTVPHILRQKVGSSLSGHDTSWQYVGEAYCDGIMDGEAVGSGHENATTFNIF